MNDDRILSALIAARATRMACALVTVAATSGSVPRSVGAKMLVYLTGDTIGTIGGGKLEALAAETALEVIASGVSCLKTYPLREDQPDSFGAICGGGVTLFFEPVGRREAIFLVGAGHCARAIASLGADCGFHLTVIDDRPEELELCTAAHQRIAASAADFIASHIWQKDEALILVSRNFQGDQVALQAALSGTKPGYLGMIGSRRKVLRVYDELLRKGIPAEALSAVYAPIGLDIGADAPMEIAVSILAEVMSVLRARSGAPLRLPTVER